jgi:hypothetical protein
MDSLVQPPPPLRVLRRHPARRTGDGLLRSTTETSRRLSPQIGKSPDSPGRFIAVLVNVETTPVQLHAKLFPSVDAAGRGISSYLTRAADSVQ